MASRWVLWTMLEPKPQKPAAPEPPHLLRARPYDWCEPEQAKKCALIRLMAYILSSAGLNHFVWLTGCAYLALMLTQIEINKAFHLRPASQQTHISCASEREASAEMYLYLCVCVVFVFVYLTNCWAALLTADCVTVTSGQMARELGRTGLGESEKWPKFG